MYKRILLYISCFIAFSNSLCVSLHMPQIIYYGWFMLIGLICFNGKFMRINYTMILFLIACLLSIIVNKIPSIFKSEFRLISFFIMTFAIGPINESLKSCEFKLDLFRLLNKIIFYGTIVSFLGYLLHFPMFYNASGFSGFTNHSMTMSSIGGIAFIICLKLFLDEVKNNNRARKYGLMCASISALLVCLLGASRSALGATFIALLFYLWYYVSDVKKFIRYLTFITLIALFCYPIWNPYTEMVRKKTEDRELMGGQFSSREALWKARISEFESDPIFGIGFASVDLNTTDVRENGGIEPGTSWLFLLSSVGLLGTLFFSILMFRPIIKFMFNPNRYPPEVLFVITLLVWRCVHLIAEGYIMASGDFSFLHLWLLLALANVSIDNNYKITHKIL